jgi:hypothetical protein
MPFHGKSYEKMDDLVRDLFYGKSICKWMTKMGSSDDLGVPTHFRKAPNMS